MGFGVEDDKVEYRISDILVALEAGTTDNPETLWSSNHKLHSLPHVWNPDTLSYDTLSVDVDGGVNSHITNERVPVYPHGTYGDPAGRFRVSSLQTQFSGKTLAQDNPRQWDTNGTGTTAFQNPGTLMSVTAGQYVVRQSLHWNQYYDGKPQVAEFTFDKFQPQAGVVKRFGYFSSSAAAPYTANFDGYFIESDGDQPAGDDIRLKVYRAGTLVKDIPWKNWDGYAQISGYDWSQFTVVPTDFVWLGGAVIRVLMKFDGHFLVVHQFDYAGLEGQDVMFQSSNQPLRYEIRSTTGAGSFKAICSLCGFEGTGTEEGEPLALITGPAAPTISTAAANTIYALKGVKKQVALRNIHSELTAFGGTAQGTGNVAIAGRFLLLLSPALSAPLTYANNSRIQEGSALAGQTVTNVGRILSSLPVFGSGVSKEFLKNYLASLLIDLDDVPQEVVLAYQPFSANQTASGTLELRED